ncbi:hypothetical protein PR048_019301 [Dryococelus australis]|uniref:Uncharacterized protein n=1 Tax=Dryococelus australis TaxID=614101 RepID=A0ABQ9H339_9NEOP|nr:hypothetical protein PR048_019301 [Dryococelus australis]
MNFQFILAFNVIVHVIKCKLPLSRQLPNTNLDIGQADDMAKAKVLATENYGNEECFNGIFQNSVKIIKIPRINARNLYKCIPDLNPGSYHRIEFHKYQRHHPNIRREIKPLKYRGTENFCSSETPGSLTELEVSSVNEICCNGTTNLNHSAVYNMYMRTIMHDLEKNKVAPLWDKRDSMACLHFTSIETFLWMPFKLWISSRENIQRE